MPEHAPLFRMEAELHMGMEEEQALKQVQEARARTGRIADITTQIRMAAEDYVAGLVSVKSGIYPQTSQLINDRTFPGIVARVTREALFAYANRGLSFSPPSDASSSQELTETIEACVDGAFREWWGGRTDFVPSYNQYHESAFIKAHPPLAWMQAASKIERAKARVCGQVQEMSPESEVVEAVIHADRMYNIRTDWRHHFERVRSAHYRAVDRADAGSIVDRLERSYNHALLQPQTIVQLESDDPAERRAFRQTTRRGVFVNGYRESIDGRPSVAEQMRCDFGREYARNEPRYQGRYLEDEHGEIIAWLTWYQPPHKHLKRNNDNTSMIRAYLKRGVTGGRMNYALPEYRGILHRKASTTLMIDTIRAEVPLAAWRLMAKATREMCENSPYLTDFMGYRLGDVRFSPPLKGTGIHDRVHWSENSQSHKFFSRLGCTNFAEDGNRKSGPRSRRVLPDGREIFLHPHWVAFVGDIAEVASNAKEIWLNEANRYGDVSGDGFE